MACCGLSNSIMCECVRVKERERERERERYYYSIVLEHFQTIQRDSYL